MTEKSQKATNVRCKHNIHYKTVKIHGIYHSLDEAFEFCHALFAGEHKKLYHNRSGETKLHKFTLIATP